MVLFGNDVVMDGLLRKDGSATENKVLLAGHSPHIWSKKLLCRFSASSVYTTLFKFEHPDDRIGGFALYLAVDPKALLVFLSSANYEEVWVAPKVLPTRFQAL